MEQHSIPQNVTAYQFRLVGDMTLKQFLELAAGGGLAFLITRFTILPVFFRWPLAGIFAFLGIALAFLPIEERPLDQWLRNFVKSIYSPTQFLWKKTGVLPGFFTFVPGKEPALAPKAPPKNQQQLRSFVRSFQASPPSPLDEQELTKLKRINQLLGASQPAPNFPFSPQPSLNILPGVKTRPLRTQSQIKKEEKVVFRQPPPGQAPKPAPLKKAAPLPSLPQAPVKQTPVSPGPKVEIIPPYRPPLRVTSLYPGPLPKVSKNRVAPLFDKDLPLPTAPESPNLITGMVVTYDGRLIPGAIIETCNNQGQTVRALKTNKLGQFFIATPLLNGQYELKAEHPKESFDIISLKVEGKIIPPIKIRAKKKAQETGSQEVIRPIG